MSLDQQSPVIMEQPGPFPERDALAKQILVALAQSGRVLTADVAAKYAMDCASKLMARRWSP